MPTPPRHRVLVTSRHHIGMVLPHRRAELDAANVEIVIPDLPRPTLNEAELLAALPGCEAVIAMPDAYTARVIEAAAPPLRLIARTGVGFDSIDVETATARGVWVTTTVGSNHDAVADYALGLLLCLARHIVETVNLTRSGTWQRTQGWELRDKTLGVIGTGRVGREVAQRAQAFGMAIVAHDLYPNEDWARSRAIRYVTLDELLTQSDVITLHAPLTQQTRHLLNQETLGRCKPGSFIVNTARGELIDEPALLAALNTGQVAGAALDVFSEEPPVDRSLLEHPHVLPTAHSAGGSREAQTRSAHMAIDEVLRVLRSERPRSPVNEL